MSERITVTVLEKRRDFNVILFSYHHNRIVIIDSSFNINN